MEKRIINYRPLLFAFMGLMFGIIISRLFLLTNVSAWLISILIALVVIGIAIIFAYTFVLKKKDASSHHRQHVYMYLRLSMIAMFIMVIIGSVISIAPYMDMMRLHSEYDVSVTGVVYDHIQKTGTSTRLLLRNCSITDDGGSRDLNYSISLSSSKYLNVSLGDTITFVGDLNSYYYANDYNFSSLASGVGYSTYIDAGHITIVSHNPSIADAVKNRVDAVLSDNMNDENASISMAMLFGDKSSLSSDIRQSFSHVGVAHILAVSGLHVSVLLGILYVLFKKIRYRWVGIAIYSIILLFYVYLCGFTVSVTRAAIMAMVLYLSFVVGYEYDSISSLSIAGIVILLFNPMQLYTISFQLSFLCIFAIITFAPHISKLLMKIKCPKVLASTLAISISTNIVLLPIMMNNFNEVSLLGIIFNIAVIPIFSIAYTLLFVIAILCCIISAFGFLLFIPDMLLHVIKWLVGIGSNINALVFHTFVVGYWIVFFIICLCLILHFVMIRHKIKLFTSAVLVIICLSILIYGFLPNNYRSEQLLLHYQTNSNVVYYVQDNRVTMIGVDIGSTTMSSMCKDLKINRLDGIVAYDFSIKDLHNLEEICHNMSVGHVYLPAIYRYSEVEEHLPDVIYYDGEMILGSVVIKDIVHSDVVLGCEIVTHSYGNMIVAKNKLSTANIQYLYNEYKNANYLISCRLSKSVSLDIMEPHNVIIYSESDVYMSLYRQQRYTFNLGE